MDPIGLVILVGVVVIGILFLLAGSRATSGRGEGTGGGGGSSAATAGPRMTAAGGMVAAAAMGTAVVVTNRS
jgi:hypothetical protein